MSQNQLWTPANAITASRLVMGPASMWLLLIGTPRALWAALIIMIVAELSDLADGYVARYSKRVSNFGKLLDPMADGLYRGSVFIAFVLNGWMAVWMLAIIIWRDLAVSYLREIAELRSETLAARVSGKWKAIVQGAAQIIIVGLAALFGTADFPAFEMTAHVLLLIATAVTAYSLVDYTVGVLQKMVRAG